jgi:hypothetical protein
VTFASHGRSLLSRQKSHCGLICANGVRWEAMDVNWLGKRKVLVGCDRDGTSVF